MSQWRCWAVRTSTIQQRALPRPCGKAELRKHPLNPLWGTGEILFGYPRALPVKSALTPIYSDWRLRYYNLILAGPARP